MKNRGFLVPSLQKNQAPVLPAADLESMESGRLMARAVAANAKIAIQLPLARSFGAQLIRAWWAIASQGQQKPVPIREPFQDFHMVALAKPVANLASDLARVAAALPVESAAHFIGSIYTSMLPGEHRSSYGVFYTPPSLTERLIDQAESAGVDWTKARILDPACGGGAFLAPVARRVVAALKGTSEAILLRSLASRLRGYEIDPFAAWLSQVTLDAVLLPITHRTGRRLPVLVTVCDSLQKSPPKERFDLVIGNPPYGRITLKPEERERFKRSLFGHANLYGLFTDLALRHAKPNGIIAYVTPTSFLAGEYFKNLRALLGRDAPPVAIDFVAARKGVFDDVLQETSLTIYRRGRAAGPIQVEELTVHAESGVSSAATGTICLPSDPSQPWLLPRHANQSALVVNLVGMGHRLADWGYAVSTGPLVWNRKKSQLSARCGRNRVPLIWAEAVVAGGVFAWRAEKKNHTLYFELRAGDQSLIVDRPCVLLQRTTAKEQHRRLIAAALPVDFLREHRSVVIENHLNMIRPIVDVPAVPPEVLAAFFNSAAADNAFRCVSGSVAVSAYELESLPLPAPEELTELLVAVKDCAPTSRIEAICHALYAPREEHDSACLRQP